MSDANKSSEPDIIRDFAHEMYNSCDPALRDDLRRYFQRMSMPGHKKRHETFLREFSECFPAADGSDRLMRSAKK